MKNEIEEIEELLDNVDVLFQKQNESLNHVIQTNFFLKEFLCNISKIYAQKLRVDKDLESEKLDKATE